MKTCHVNTDQIWKVWNWCFESYLRSGIRLSFPKNTEPSRTYQWRYCKSIAGKFSEWDFDDDSAQHFIDVAVKYARDTGTLRKGLSILHQGNVLDEIHKRMESESESNNGSIDILSRTKQWLDSKIGDRDPVEVMLERADDDSLVNIAMWYQANKIPSLYIALSKTCCRALARLKDQKVFDRECLPKVTELYKIRVDFIDRDGNLDDVRKVLGKDWRKLCH